jgi:hypothetical protein
MAEPANPTEAVEDEAPEKQESTSRGSVGLVGRLLSKRGLLILLAVSIVGHAVTFTCFQLTGDSPQSGSCPEFSLGEFQFVADPSEGGPIARAEFSLHITLLDEVDRVARKGLEEKKFRVQQGIEELIRRAHGGDFDDPVLGGLKRQLQEQINQTLGVRVIADVIITDLLLERNSDALGPISETADALPWTEEPSS